MSFTITQAICFPRKNMHPLNVEAMLVKEKGLTREEAHMVVTNIDTDVAFEEEEDSSGAIKDLVLGAVFCGGGLILNPDGYRLHFLWCDHLRRHYAF